MKKHYLDLGFHVGKPQRYTVGQHVESSLEDGPRPGQFPVLQLKTGVLQPVLQGDPVPPYVVFILSPLSALVLVQLLEVGKALGWRLERYFLPVDGFPE